MSGLEQRIADVCRGFIVRSVGQDMGALMTEQAKDLAAEIMPEVADEFERLSNELDEVKQEMREVDSRTIRSAGLSVGIERLRQRANELRGE